MQKYYDLAAVREALTGAVPSIGATFRKNGDIDYPALKRYVDFLIESGSRSLLLTFGDSLLSVLSDQETVELTKAVVDAADHRAMVIGCGKQWSTRQSVEFAEACVDMGCDVVIPVPHDWQQHCGTDLLADFFREIGKIAPTMILSNLMCGRPIPVSVYERLGADCGVVAIKDDAPHPYGVDAMQFVRDKMAVLSGGTMKFFLLQRPYGADGYLSIYARCFPEVEKPFRAAYEAGRYEDAARIIEKHEMSFFRWCAANGAHFDAGIRGMIELAGQAERWVRAPYSQLSDAQMDSLRCFLQETGVI